MRHSAIQNIKEVRALQHRLDQALKNVQLDASMEKQVCQAMIILALHAQHHQCAIVAQQDQQDCLPVGLQPKNNKYIFIYYYANQLLLIVTLIQHTFTITFVLNIYEEKNTQKTSYISNPVSNNVDTFRLGKRTNAIKATHKPIPIASINNQWPVNTHMHTILTLSENESNSAPVNLPQTPNDILLPSEHGRIMYWHMGKRRNANATVAITKKKKTKLDN